MSIKIMRATPTKKRKNTTEREREGEMKRTENSHYAHSTQHSNPSDTSRTLRCAGGRRSRNFGKRDTRADFSAHGLGVSDFRAPTLSDSSGLGQTLGVWPTFTQVYTFFCTFFHFFCAPRGV